MTSVKKVIATCIVILLISLATIPTINGNTNNSKLLERLSQSQSEDYENYIEAASPYDYGLKVGRQFRFQYKLLDTIASLTKNDKVSEEDVENEMRLIEQYCPYFLEELKGLSASLNIRPDRLIFIMKALSPFISNRCTTTLSTGPATKNNETFLTQNLDRALKTGVGKYLHLVMFRLFNWKCRIVRINTMRYRYAFVGIPILKEYPLMNEKGLGFGGNGNSFTENESRHTDEGPGISSYMLMRLSMMTCKNVSEVAKLWKGAERASGGYRGWPHMFDNMNTVWCDEEGGIMMMEQTNSHIITVFGDSTEITGASEGILWHANHHQWLDPNITGSVTTEEYPASGLRAERSRELLETYYGNITLDVCKSICRDHGGGTDMNGKDSSDICRHPDKNLSYATAISWIIQPNDLTVYLTHRSPCRSRFIKHDLSKIFG